MLATMAKENNLVDCLKSAGNSGKGITFIQEAGPRRFLAYRDLFSRARSCLADLESAGIRAGDSLILQIRDSEQFLILFWACLMGRIIPVPLTLATADEYRLKLLKVWQVLKTPYAVFDRSVYTDFETYLSERGLEETLPEIRKKQLFFDAFSLDRHHTAIEETPGPGDTAYIQFSSGSTGDPKGIVLSHGNLLANIHAFLDAKKAQPDDTYLSWLPLTHDMGLIGWHLNPVAASADQYLIPPETFVRDPALWLDTLSSQRVTITGSPNFGLSHCLKSAAITPDRNWDLSCVRLIVTGAEHISHGLCSTFLESLAMFGLKPDTLMPGYGLAEATLAVSVSPCGEPYKTHYLDVNRLGIGDRVRDLDASEPDSVPYVDEGMLLPGFAARICDNDGRVLPDNTVGHILLKSPSIAAGYVNNPAATGETFTEDGWLRTGDLGFIRNQRLVITGRSREMIILAGMNYYPHDIERVAARAPEAANRSLAACGVYDPGTSAEELVIFVSHRQELDAFVPVVNSIRKTLAADFNLPVSRVIPIPSIPRTTSGKIQRVSLAAQVRQGQFNPVIHRLNQLLNRQLKPLDIAGKTPGKKLEMTIDFIQDRAQAISNTERIDPDLSLASQGIDSLMAIDLRNAIEVALSITVPISWFRKNETLREFASRIMNSLAEPEPEPVPAGAAFSCPSSLLDQLKEIDRMDDDQIRKMLEALGESSQEADAEGI